MCVDIKSQNILVSDSEAMAALLAHESSLATSEGPLMIPSERYKERIQIKLCDFGVGPFVPSFCHTSI